MLLQFNLKNYKSFKDENVLSMIAGADQSHEDILIPFRNERVLPSVSIYGANASGKTNINKALVFAIRFVRTCNSMQVTDKINVVPFLLDDESKNNKSRFDFIFVHEGIKYEYGFTVNQEKVFEEYLYEYRTHKASKIFERTDVNQYSFSSATKKLSAIVPHNTDNKLFLSTATQWNSELTKKAFMWFVEGIEVYDSSNLERFFFTAMENGNDDNMKQFMSTMMKNADMNIVGYDLSVKQGNPAKIQLPPGIKFEDDFYQKVHDHLKEWQLETYHQVIKDGQVKKYVLPMQAESNGTRNLMYLAPFIKDALTLGKTMIVDEIDSGLHPLLVKYLIGLFHDRMVNKCGAQLVFNTHDISQLTLEQFRRDQIYFVEKDNFTGVSNLYSLDEYSPRKSENVQKGYMQGRYGAIPVIGIEEIKW